MKINKPIDYFLCTIKLEIADVRISSRYSGSQNISNVMTQVNVGKCGGRIAPWRLNTKFLTELQYS